MPPPPTSGSVSCRIDRPPVVREALRAQLDDVGFDTRYLAPTHAVHVHDYDGVVRIGRRTFALRRGDLTLSPAGVASWYDLPRPGHHWVAHFEAVRGAGIQARLPLHLPLGARRAFAEQRIAWMGQLLASSRRPPRSTAATLAARQASACMLELLAWIARVAAEERPDQPHHRADVAVDRVTALLQARLTDPLDVPALAAEVGVSQNHLAARFRRRTGVTIPRYLLLRRIEHAQVLLRNTTLPVQRIAARVGLPDPHHFNKQFRRMVGQSPTAFREA